MIECPFCDYIDINDLEELNNLRYLSRVCPSCEERDISIANLLTTIMENDVNFRARVEFARLGTCLETETDKNKKIV